MSLRTLGNRLTRGGAGGVGHQPLDLINLILAKTCKDAGLDVKPP